MANDYPIYRRGAGDDGETLAAGGEQAVLHPEERIGRITEVSGSGAVAVVEDAARSALLYSAEGQAFHVGQVGSMVKIRVGNSWVYAIIRKVRSSTEQGFEGRGSADIQYLDLDFIGQGDIHANSAEVTHSNRGISSFPVPGLEVMTATDHDLHAIFSPLNAAHVAIGTIYPTHVVPASLLIDPFLGKHFAVLGSTGTGKSCTVALIIHKIVQDLPNGHVLILDPHNEYERAFSENGVHFDTENLSLPYWMMNFEEHVEIFIGMKTPEKEVDIDILKRCLLAARKKSPGADIDVSRVTIDSPVPYRLADLVHELEDGMGRFEKPESHVPFLRLKNKIEELKNDARYGFMFSGLLLSDNLQDTVSRLLRFPSQGRPVTTLDLSGVPSDIVDVVVSVLARMVFDFALWSRKEGSARPLVFICEEAHRYVPARQTGYMLAARRSIERIAKEGRKYGVSLGLISQRPSELSESVLSQCGTIVTMRMNNERDRHYVEAVMPEGSQGFLDSIPSLGKRECIISGEGVNAPVRVKLEFLPEEQRPSSDDPTFSTTWQFDVNDPDYAGKVIRRWRGRNRGS